jgi:formylglycine-generating enzyme required for sulfatase activity
MAGNVWEWTRSLGDYPYPTDQQERARRENLKADRDTPRVLRGGAFFDLHGYVRCAYRCWDYPSFSNRDIGFRVVVHP